MNNIDVIKIHDKKFTLPKRRREILTNWYSGEDITNENHTFEQMYNNLPKIDKYEPVSIMEGAIASIAILTKGKLVIKSAEIIKNHKAKAISLYSMNPKSENLLRYKQINGNEELLESVYLEGFEGLSLLDDVEILALISKMVQIVKEINYYETQPSELYETDVVPSKYCSGRRNFIKNLNIAVQDNKVTCEHAQILEKIYIDLDMLPIQVIHGDLGRKNVMYKNDHLIVIDPKITLGRPMEDLAYFILKGGSCKEPNDIIKIINKTLEQLSCDEALELKNWLFIYNISIYVEYIKKINESTKIKMIPRIEKVFDYINQQLTEKKVSY